jgi:pyrroline-5-carboxylate reductase
MANDLKNMRLAFIGCGVMGESMVAGLLRKEIVDRKGISASHPRENRRQELKEKYGISVFEGNADAAKTVAGVGNSAIVLCVKPQRLANVLNDLKGVLSADQLVVSIVAGCHDRRLEYGIRNEADRAGHAEHSVADRCRHNGMDMHGRGRRSGTSSR